MKLAALEKIVSTLNNANVNYLVVGGLAVAAHGFGRATFDIDLVVQLQSENIKHAMHALESLNYRPMVPVPAEDFARPEVRKNWVEEKNMIVFQMHSDEHPETRIDLFVTEPFDFDKEYDNAMVGDILPGLQVRFVSIETLINMKKLADREKDKEDIRQLQMLLDNHDAE